MDLGQTNHHNLKGVLSWPRRISIDIQHRLEWAVMIFSTRGHRFETMRLGLGTTSGTFSLDILNIVSLAPLRVRSHTLKALIYFLKKEKR